MQPAGTWHVRDLARQCISIAREREAAHQARPEEVACRQGAKMDHKHGQKREWKNVTPHQKGRIAIIGLIELVLTSIALWDLSHRPATQVKGKKWVWAIVSCVQPFGAVIYLL